MADTKISTVAIGEKLKAAREKKSLTIDQVQKKTHIHSSVLRALEEGTCDEILTPVYVRSFLKTYAHHLGLDSRDILKEYSSNIPKEKAPQAQPIVPAGTEEKDAGLIPKIVYGATLIIGFIIVLSLVVFLSQRLAGSLKKFREGRKAAQVRMETTKGKKTVKRETARYAVSKTAAKQAVPREMASFTLVLKVKQSVLVKVKKDGITLFERVLSKGTSESFTADKKIELYVAKAEAIELVLNGESLGSPGRGVIKNIEVTSKGIRIK